jgi:hypothetical protein
MLLFVCGAGILQAALLSGVIYFYPKTDRSVNQFLAFYIICFCVPMMTPVLQTIVPWQYLLFVDPIPLLTGPMLYFYIRSFKEYIDWKKAWPHLIFFGVYVVFDTTLFVELNSKYPPSHVVPVEVVHYPPSIIRVCGRLIQMIAYFFFAMRELKAYQKSINHMFSETSRVDLNWVKWLVNGYLFLLLVMATLYIMILSFPEYFHLFIMINTAFVTPYLYIITFKGVTQPTIWQVQKADRNSIQEELKHAEELEMRHEAESETTQSDEKAVIIVERTIRLIFKPTLRYRIWRTSCKCNRICFPRQLTNDCRKLFMTLSMGIVWRKPNVFYLIRKPEITKFSHLASIPVSTQRQPSIQFLKNSRVSHLQNSANNIRKNL